MAEFSLGQAVLGTAVDLSGLQAGQSKAKQQTESWAAGLQKNIGKGLLAGVGLVTAAITGIGVAAGAVAQDFDDAGDVLIAATGASGPALDAMSASVVALHGTVAGLNRSMTDIAGVMGEVSTRTGATGPALDEFTAQILKMTAITGGDGVAAVQGITRVMGDWSVPLEESSLLMDKLFGAGQVWGIGLDSLAGKLVQFGAPLRQMGFGLDESIAMLGKWEKEGVNVELVLGSLRIAAGKFAKEQGESSDAVVGGVKSLAEAQTQMDKLRQKLQIAQMQQAEFTEKTKASSRLKKEQEIAETTRQIEELESAMALGEFRTISSTSANKSLSESLRETFAAIKNASSGTEALNIGMETFGARAGPDMTAAIREGRFELDDAIAAMEGMAGSIDDVTERSTGFSERWQMSMTRVRDSLLPIGNELMGLGLQAMPFVESAAGKLANFLSVTLPGVIGDVSEAWAEDWMGIRTTAEETGQGLEIEWIKMRLQAALLIREMQKEFSDADITIDWTGIRIPITAQTEFVLTWEDLWRSAQGVTSRGFVNIFAQIGRGLQYMRGLLQYGHGLITGDWESAWEGWKTAAGAGLDSVLGLVEVWSPELASLIRGIGQMMVNILKAEWELYSGWFRTAIIEPVARWFEWLKGNDNQPHGTFGRRFDNTLTPDPTGYVPGYATGTDFAPGGWAIVGEQGPELVELPRGSRVFPAGETREMVAGGGWQVAGGADSNQSVSSVFRELVSRDASSTESRSSDSNQSVSSVFRELVSRDASSTESRSSDSSRESVSSVFRELVSRDASSTESRSSDSSRETVSSVFRELVSRERMTSALSETIQMLAGIPAYAMGTASAVGGLALVGERGRELVQLPGSPGQAGQAGAVNITNNNIIQNDIDMAIFTERMMNYLRRQQEMQAWQPTF